MPKRVTKRVILSEVSKIFDPLGLISPVVVFSKILLQFLSSLKLSWDQEVPDELLQKWLAYRLNLFAYRNIPQIFIVVLNICWLKSEKHICHCWARIWLIVLFGDVLLAWFRPTNPQKLMEQLPEPRVTAVPPLKYTGVNYAGPLIIKDRPGRGCIRRKCYLYLFVCLTTKAVHLQLVSSLSTSAFLQTFLSRVDEIHLTDTVKTGLVFLGASNELRNLVHFKCLVIRA